jgi:hypothetical protein
MQSSLEVRIGLPLMLAPFKLLALALPVAGGRRYDRVVQLFACAAAT